MTRVMPISCFVPISLIVAAIFCTSAQAADASTADLQALAAQKGYAEIVARAGEVSPSLRDAAWQKVVLDAALIQAKASKVDEFSSFDDDIAARFPTVAQTAEYQTLAHTRQIESATACMSKSYSDVEYCIEALNKAAARDPKNMGFAYQAAEVIAVGSNAYNAMLMLRKSVSTDDKKHCSSARTVDITIAALGTPAGKTADAAAELSDICFAQLSGPINKAMASESTGGYVLKSACALMQKRSAVKGLTAQKCTDTLAQK